MDLSYILNELGEERELYYNAVSPPIMQTSNFVFDTVDDMRRRFKDEYGGYIYSRGLNPTVDILRKKLAAMDGAEDALVFNSGASAIFSAVVPFVSSGDHIVSVKEPYFWAQKLFGEMLPRFGVQTTYVDGRDVEQFRQAIRPETRIIYMESPNSWTFALQDLEAIAALAKPKNILCVVDNSYCSPYYQKPIEMGMDLVLQSATKYISGHSDTVAGVLTGSKALLSKIFNLEYLTAGNGIQPFNAWLLLRGLRTLPARMDRISSSTQKLIGYLKSQEHIEAVYFPMDPDFPQYELARRQMSGACGLFTVILKTREPKKIEMFCEALKHFFMAVSWGGHESLVIPKVAGMDHEAFDPDNVWHRSVRIYVGLEDPEYLIADLSQALSRI
ncbi:MAG TPA: aminotransferase class I/II-fold pyridoxal phosphate-dependent enzyme [Saprospiraceae bacterium]|nr:aminotransferase class I/II-fold pyridoxal phosphate-dependent enzyme [Saprospiraceae bacterium]